MSSLSLPDVNVWLALASAEHVHSGLSRRWWAAESGDIAFCRFTQMGLLRLITTAAAMDGAPLSLDDAWRVYDGFFRDSRIVFLGEPENAGQRFRRFSTGDKPSPKLLADAWLLAFARASGATLVTFDRALGARGAHCL